MKITQCKGEGQGSCKRCVDNGKWNRSWMCFLYKIEGYDGCYCKDCVKEIQIDKDDMTKMFMNVDKLEEIPAVDIFDLLTEKEKAKAKRRGLRSIKLDRFLDKLPISERFADVIRGIYWRC